MEEIRRALRQRERCVLYHYQSAASAIMTPDHHSARYRGFHVHCRDVIFVSDYVYVAEVKLFRWCVSHRCIDS